MPSARTTPPGEIADVIVVAHCQCQVDRAAVPFPEII